MSWNLEIIAPVGRLSPVKSKTNIPLSGALFIGSGSAAEARPAARGSFIVVVYSIMSAFPATPLHMGVCDAPDKLSKPARQGGRTTQRLLNTTTDRRPSAVNGKMKKEPSFQPCTSHGIKL